MIRLLEADRIPGFMPIRQMAWFATEATRHHAIVEVGCWRGRTTTALCLNTPGQVYAVDTFKGSPELSEDLAFMQELTGDPEWLAHDFQRNTATLANLTVIVGPSIEAADHFADSSVDMIILDAAHDHDSVLADIIAWWPKVAINGMMCGHDLAAEGVQQAVMEFFQGFPPSGDDYGIWKVQK